MNTLYFPSRTAARDYVKADGGKFKDQGADAPKGERWSVLVQATVTETVEATAPQYKNKMQHATAVVEQLIASNAKRKDIISQLMSVVGLTKNGASTYHQTIKTKLKAAQ